MSRFALFVTLVLEFASVATLCLFGYPTLGAVAGLFWAALDAWLVEEVA